MSSRLLGLTIDALDRAGLAAFWAGLLEWEPTDDPRAGIAPPPRFVGGFPIRFQQTEVPKTLVFASSAVLDWETLLLGVMIGICTIPGTYSGYWIIRKTPVRVHTMLVEALVILGGAYFIYLAVS